MFLFVDRDLSKRPHKYPLPMMRPAEHGRPLPPSHPPLTPTNHRRHAGGKGNLAHLIARSLSLVPSLCVCLSVCTRRKAAGGENRGEVCTRRSASLGVCHVRPHGPRVAPWGQWGALPGCATGNLLAVFHCRDQCGLVVSVYLCRWERPILPQIRFFVL